MDISELKGLEGKSVIVRSPGKNDFTMKVAQAFPANAAAPPDAVEAGCLYVLVGWIEGIANYVQIYPDAEIFQKIF